MEAQIYLYIWDNRWVWGLPNIRKTSVLWTLSIIMHLGTLIEVTKKEFDLTHITDNNPLLIDLVSNLLCLWLFIRQRWTIENRKFLTVDFIDEDEWKIGHYLKRREAVYTWQAHLLFLIGIFRALRLSYLYLWLGQ